MKVIYKGCECTDSDINEFEEYFQIAIPQAYRSFLKQWNGCIVSPENEVFLAKEELPGGSEIVVGMFLTFDKRDSKLTSVYNTWEDFGDLIPIGSMPIALDAFGNLILMELESTLMSWILMEARFLDEQWKVYDLAVTLDEFIGELVPLTSASFEELVSKESWFDKFSQSRSEQTI
jgi:hypothetical protein